MNFKELLTKINIEKYLTFYIKCENIKFVDFSFNWRTIKAASKLNPDIENGIQKLISLDIIKMHENDDDMGEMTLHIETTQNIIEAILYMKFVSEEYMYSSFLPLKEERIESFLRTMNDRLKSL